MENAWDKDAPWLNAIRVPYHTKVYLWEQIQAGAFSEKQAQSYNWGDFFAGIGSFVDYLKQAFGIVLPQREVDFQNYIDTNSLKDLFETEQKVDKALKTRRGLDINNVQYSLSDLQKFVKPAIDSVQTNRVQVAIDKYETDALKSAQDKARLQQMKVDANQSVKDAQYTFDSAKDAFNNNPEPRYERMYRQAAINLQSAQETLARLTAKPGTRVPRTVAPTAVTPGTTAPTTRPITTAAGVTAAAPTPVTTTVGGATAAAPTAAPGGLTAAQTAEEVRMRTEAYAGRVPKPSGPSGTGRGTTQVVVTKQDVNAALAKSGLPDTPENRKTIRADLKAGKQPVGDWLTVFKKEFPQYTYLLDENVFGADVTALLQRAVAQKWYDSDQAATLMEQAFTGTQYYQNTTTSQQTFDKLTPANKDAKIQESKLSIQQTYGNLQFDDATLTTIATKAARDGKKGKALDIYIFQESFAKPVGGTEFAQPTAASRALTSTAADEVRKVGRDYGVKVDDQTIQDVLVGKTTLDDLRQSYKIAARRWYKGAADDIDAGVTVSQLFQPYKQYAAAVLGKPMDQIDFIDANGTPTIYSEALQGKDGPMSIGEWVQKLKSDDRYGWQFTSDAKQKADSLVMSLEKAFGYRA